MGITGVDRESISANISKQGNCVFNKQAPSIIIVITEGIIKPPQRPLTFIGPESLPLSFSRRNSRSLNSQLLALAAAVASVADNGEATFLSVRKKRKEKTLESAENPASFRIV
ncbi:hypothetical protein AAC387_Pa03g1325 [Persea americana]